MYREELVDDEWDPMRDAFYNERFNTYQEGPGAYLDRALQPCFKRRSNLQKPLCKLYIHKIPTELTEEGLRNMFMKFGIPTSVYLCKKPNTADLNWGFVEYTTMSEGQEAINELNGRPPLNLGVQFARSDEEKERMRKEYEEDRLIRKLYGSYDVSYELPEMESPYPRAIGRGRGIPLLPQPSVQEIFCRGYNAPVACHDSRNLNTYIDDEEDEIVFMKRIPRGVFSPYKGSMWDPSNAHVMGNVSLTVNSSQEGRRISMGRATNVPYVETRPKFRRHTHALQQFELDKNDFRIGFCAYCDLPSKYSCGRCGTWYCSEDCQKDDWPEHKAICLRLGAHPSKTKEPQKDEYLEQSKGGGRQGVDLQMQKERKSLGGSNVEDNIEENHCLSVPKGNSQFKQSSPPKRDGRDRVGDDTVKGQSSENWTRRTSRETAGDNSKKDYKSQEFNQRRKYAKENTEKRESDERRSSSIHESGRKANNDNESWEIEQDRMEERNRVEQHKVQGVHRRERDVQRNSYERKWAGDDAKGSALQKLERKANEECWESKRESAEGRNAAGQNKFQGFHKRGNDGDEKNFVGRRDYNGRKESCPRQGGRVRTDDDNWDDAHDVAGANKMAFDSGNGYKVGGSGHEERGREKEETITEDGGKGRDDAERGEERKREWKYERRGGGERRGTYGRGRGRDERGGRGRDGAYRPRGGAGGAGAYQRPTSDSSTPTSCAQDDGDWETDKSAASPTIPSSPTEINASESPFGDSCMYNQCVELSSGKFTQVSIGVVVSPGQYWIQSNEEQKDLISIMKIMNDDGKPNGKPFTPKVGGYCSALFESFPYRAKVLSVESDRAKVFYIDFGNVDTCEFVNMGEIPPSARKYKSQAIQIVMAEGTPEKYLNLPDSTIVNVKPVRKNKSEAVVVEVEGVDYKEISPSHGSPANALVGSKIDGVVRMPDAAASPVADENDSNKKMQWPNSVVQLLKDGLLAVCEVFSVENDSAILGLAFEDISQGIMDMFEEFPKECLRMPKVPNLRPSIGDLIAAYDDDKSWKRGVVIGEESSGWVVAFCDTGIVKTVKEVHKMPKDAKFKEAPAIAVKCSIVKSLVPRSDLFAENKMKVGSRLRLKISARKGDEVDADVETETQSVFCKVKLEMWRPEAPNPKCIVLNNGDKVQVVSYFNLAAIYVQPADRVSQSKIQRLLQDVSGACMPIGGSRALKQIPSKGTIVGCKFSGDGNFYRALITNVKSPSEISVSYIDFGNQESVSLERIHDLPDELKKIPSFAVKIGLKMSNVTQLTKEAVMLLNELILENEELKFVCADEDLRSCELYTKSGTSLNEKIDELLEPSWKKPTKQPGTSVEKTFTMSSLIEEKLPAPARDGETISIKFLILNCPGRCTVVGCQAENPLIRHVYKSFPAEMSEYCEKCPKEPYVPKHLEMCLAKFTDGLWYRAFAVDSKDDESSVYFVDFGNWTKVNHKDIRKMISDFMKVPVLATLCSYKGFEEETMTDKQEKRLKELLKPNSVVTARMWPSSDSDDYILDVPEVTDTLKLENLLP